MAFDKSEKLDVLTFIKSEGGKTSGGKVKTEFKFDDETWKSMRNELKDEGKVILGRGRGGTVALIEDGASVPEAKPKDTKAKTEAKPEVEAEESEKDKQLKRENNLAVARETKKRQSKEAKQNKEIIDTAVAQAKKDFPDYFCEFHAVDSLMRVYICVWHVPNSRAAVRTYEVANGVATDVTLEGNKS